MNAQVETLVCPGCMGTYERNGIKIEQGEERRAIFLDRRKLKRLIGVENSYLGADPESRGPCSDYLPGDRGGHHGGGEPQTRDARRQATARVPW